MSEENDKKRPRPSDEDNDDGDGDTTTTTLRRCVDNGTMMDSLPYVDAVHEDYEQYALALIEEEMKIIQPPKLPMIPDVKFRTKSMEQEYRRLVEADDGKPTTESSIRVQLEEDTKLIKPDEKCTDVETWRKAVQKAKAQYEAERIRSINIEIKKDDTIVSNLWKLFNTSLDTDLITLQKSLSQQKEIVEQINFQRNQEQQNDGKQLHILTMKYQQAIERKFHLQQAIKNLETEMNK